MNLAFPVLLALSFAGLAWRRRSESALAWWLCGLAGIAVLAPTMVTPASIPSPSLLLEHIAPWRTGEPPPATNAELMDLTFMIEPWLLHLREELRAGRLPFWNPHQFAGAPFWGNGSSAPLFPLHLLFAALPLSIGFVVIAWLRIVIGGVGTFRLARELGISRQGALLAGVIFPLSGRVIAFLMFPMANALCLVPWVFLAVERIARGRTGAWRDLALAGGLQLLAGHPETAVFTALASGLYLVVRGSQQPTRGPEERPTPGSAASGERLRVAFGFLGGWLLALAVAAVQIVPLAHTIFDSARWVELERGAAVPIAVTLQLWTRFLLPNAFGHAGDGSWWGPFSFVPTTVYCGALALPLAALAVARRWADRRLRALGLIGAVCLLVSYSLPGLRELVLALPVLRNSLYHYLLLGTMIALAVLAGAGVDAVRESGGRRTLGRAVGAPALLLALAWLVFGTTWSERGQLGEQASWTVWVLLIWLALFVAVRPARGPAATAALSGLLALTVLDLSFAHARIHPATPLARHFSSSPAIEFLRGKEGRVAGVELALRPNTAMVYGLDDVRGEDSVQALAYTRMHDAHLGRTYPVSYRPIERWDERWLDRLAVRWVIAAPGTAPPSTGWTVAFDERDARVFERPTALPIARLQEPTAGRLRVIERSPGRWKIETETHAATTLVVAESNLPGWRAWLGGQRAAVERVDEYFLGVRLPPGRAHVDLRYRPPGIEWGAALSFGGLGLLAVLAALRRRR